MATLIEILPRVEPYVPGAGIPLILEELRAVLRTFCERTNAWREDLAAIDVESYATSADALAQQGIYALPLPEGAAIVTSLVVRFDGKAVEPKSEQWLDNEFPKPGFSWDGQRQRVSLDAQHWRDLEAEQPVYYLCPQPAQVQLVGRPNRDLTGGLAVTAALKPARNGDTVPDALLDDWLEVIAAGALARLKAMPEKPWSGEDWQLSAAAYRDGIDRALAKQVRSNTRDDRTVHRVRSYW